MIGQTLDRYRIEAKLGEGGMGVVYKARDTHLDRTVAIKVFPSDKVADPERVDAEQACVEVRDDDDGIVVTGLSTDGAPRGGGSRVQSRGG